MSHKENNNIETRVLRTPETRVRVINEENRTIGGYGIVFNSDSAVLYERGKKFREVIRPEAVQGVKTGRMLSMHNHKSDRLLGNTDAGTMRVITDEIGSFYETDLPNSPTGEDVLVSVRRGDTDGSSFQFVVAPDGEKWSMRDGMAYREITKFQEIHEMGPVSEPAYPGTAGLSARSVSMLLVISVDSEEETEKEEPEEMEPETEQNSIQRAMQEDEELEILQMQVYNF